LQAASSPLARLPHGLRHHEIREVRHEGVVLDRIKEMTRLQQAAAWVLPADQRLDSAHFHLGGGDGQFRLIHQREFVFGQRLFKFPARDGGATASCRVSIRSIFIASKGRAKCRVQAIPGPPPPASTLARMRALFEPTSSVRRARELEQALAEHELTLVYQPKLAIAAPRWKCAESRRWSAGSTHAAACATVSFP